MGSTCGRNCVCSELDSNLLCIYPYYECCLEQYVRARPLHCSVHVLSGPRVLDLVLPQEDEVHGRLWK